SWMRVLFTEHSQTAAAGGCSIRKSLSNLQFHLRPCSGFAPYIELRAHLLSSLAHPRQTPVSVASRVQDFPIDSLPIIADTQPEKVFPVNNFRFDLARLCVLESVSERLPRNA